jgi:hypothetical protein
LSSIHSFEAIVDKIGVPRLMPWQHHPRPISQLKRLVLAGGRNTRVIKSGAFKGIVMEIDFAHQTSLFLGLHEREIQGWLTSRSQQYSAAIDIGAAEGEYTLFFLKKTRAQRVWAFEPQSECRSLLLQNLLLNGVEADTRLILSTKFVGSGGDGQITLDSLASELARPCFIKVDVDGGEVDVLRGATQLLAKGRVDWLIETHSRDLEYECQALLGAAGYSARVIDNAWWRAVVPENRPAPHNRWLIAERRH